MMPMVPTAPVRLSMTIDQPSRALIHCATIRATPS
jgi:hypothetical protein